MNKERREKLLALVSKIEEIKGELETLKDEEQEYFDNMPESFQQGDKGQAAETAVSNIDEAFNDLDSVISKIEEAAE